MGKKPKARSPAKRSAKPAKKAKEKPQRRRFIEAAIAVGVDETGKKFERAIKKIVPPRNRATAS